MSALLSSQLLSGLLIGNTVKVTFLLIAVAAICHLARRSPAALRHQLWALAIVGVLLLPVLQIALPAWPSPTSAAGSRIWRAALSTGLLAPRPAGAGTVVNAALQESPAASWRAWIISLWMTGVVLLLLRLGTGAVRLAGVSWQANPLADDALLLLAARCSRQIGVRRPVRLLLAKDSRIMPCTWGVLYPQILLPETALTWSTERFQMVITHELAHIRRFDWCLRLLAEAARAVFWFHPLVWLAAARLREESERACDDAVLNSGASAMRYAAELLELVRNATRYPAAALTVASTSHFERRFTAMLNPNVNRARLTRKSAIITTTAACLCLGTLASLRAPAQDMAGLFTGSVVDSRGAFVPNATVQMTDRVTHEIRMTATSATGTYQFDGLPPGDYDLRVARRGFQDLSSPERVDASHNTPALLSLTSAAGADQIGALPAGHYDLRVERKDLHDLAAPGASALLTLEQTSGATPSTPHTRTIRIGSNVESANLVQKKQPVYPPDAKAAGIQGSVLLAAVIDQSGTPTDLRVVNVDVAPELARSAIETVSQWRYKPTLLNGQPVDVETTVTVHYTLTQ